MRIALLIESLGSGGAERQMCTLAAEFKRRGHEVRVASYAPGDFYLPILEKGGVPHVKLTGNSRLERIASVRRFLRSNDQEVVLAFLQGPCTYAELASLPYRRWGLVVSERIALPQAHKKRLDLQKMLHLFSDYVITNSHVNRLMLEHALPALKGRVVTIYNAVDLERFKPEQGTPPGDALRLVVASSYQAKKNMAGLIKAQALLREEEPQLRVVVDWYGDVPSDPAAYEEAVALIDRLNLADSFRLRRATSDIASQYRDADAVLLPSFYEGLPNTVCEAMACGRPVLMSAVCDAGNLVAEGVNGFLFDPSSPRSIADAVSRFARLSPRGRGEMGAAGREMAESFFKLNLIAGRFLEVLEAAARRERRNIPHWVAEVPETAKEMLTP